MSPRPPKYKPATAKAIPLQEVEVVQKSRERKVVFTDKLVHETRKSPSVRHESPATRPIIRNNMKGSDHGDNLSNSSVKFYQYSVRFPRKILLYLNLGISQENHRLGTMLIIKNLPKFSVIFNVINNREVEIS